MDWRHVDYMWIIMIFVSAVWTLILTAPIHSKWCNARLIYILEFQHIFIFG